MFEVLEEQHLQQRLEEDRATEERRAEHIART